MKSLSRVIDCAVESGLAALSMRNPKRDPELERLVSQIIEDVRTRGDAALLEIGRRFDSPELTTVLVTPEERDGAVITDSQASAIQTAFDRILQFHLKQLEVITIGMTRRKRGWSWQMSEQLDFGQRLLPLQSVGIYAPGGRALYPSTVLMLAGPAKAAEVDKVVLCTPATHSGSVDPSLLVAARVAGVADVCKVGGAAAVAAFAFGTESVPKVDKVVGPGNRYLNEAKRQLWGSVGVDGNYGPSEVCVVVDETSNALFAAADFLTQIEHAPDNAGFLISLSRAKLDEVLVHIDQILATTLRAGIVKEALAGGSLGFLVRDLDEAAELVDAIAPEHLTISTAQPEKLLGKVRNAGCILLGDWTPESAADYCLGPSHTLPTNAAARFAGPLNVLDFIKLQSVAGLTKDQIQPLIEVVEAFGEMEGFPAHALGATVRRV